MKKRNLLKINFSKWLCIALCIMGIALPARATNYYVDATNGDDSNEGTSPSTAWQTLSKVSGSSFSPGDSILFKRGETFRGQVSIPGSGTVNHPITYSVYGTGNKPLFLGSVKTKYTKYTNKYTREVPRSVSTATSKATSPVIKKFIKLIFLKLWEFA